MKKCLLSILLVMILLFPASVFAGDKVHVYMFKGDGCPHCTEAESYFKTLEKEYGDQFDLVTYEVWYNEDNAEMMQKIAEMRGETNNARGVPYIIIGDKSFGGYSSSMNQEILIQIQETFKEDPDTRYDVIEEYKKSSEFLDSDAIEVDDTDVIGYDEVISDNYTPILSYIIIGGIIVVCGVACLTGLIVVIVFLATRKKKA